MPLWTNEEIEFVQKYLRLPPVKIHELFMQEFPESGRSYDSIQKKANQLQEAFDPEEEEEEVAPKKVLPPSVIPLLPQTSPAEKARNTNAARVWLEQLVEVAEEIPRSPPVEPVQSEKTTLFVMLSDLHFGKQVEGFNTDIARDRLLDMAQQVWENSKGVDIDEVLVALMGDLVEGEDIYSNQNGSLECSLMTQTKKCVDALWEMIVVLDHLFDVPIRVECVPGNHGRMSKTASQQTNWDNAVALGLAIRAELADVKVSVSDNWKEFHDFKVKDKVACIVHQGTKHTGTPAMQSRLSGWFRSKDADFLCWGHWHSWGVSSWQNGLIIANGCLCGPDDLAERMGKMENARQGYFYITPGRPLWGFSFIEWENEYE